jgi:TonB family protein
MTCTKSRALHAAGLLLLGFVGPGSAPCAHAAAGQNPPPGEYSRPRDGADPQIAVSAAQAQVANARSGAADDPQALADALTTLGDALLQARDYTGAETAYAEALQITEQRSGSNSTQTFKPLRGLGYSLAASGRDEEAIPYMERALTIARAEYGVFDPEQMDLLHALSDSLTALGRREEAGNHMFYTLRLAEKAYGEGDPRMAPAVCALGEWFAEIYRPAGARMAYQFALNIVTKSVGADDLAAVEPLRGFARTAMQVVSYPEFALRAKGHQGVFAVDATGHRLSGPRKLTPDGEEALKRALKILDAHGQAAPRQQLIDTLIQLGDWFQIKESPREALPYYQRAWTLMTVDRSQGAPAELSFPVRVFYPTPNIVVRRAGAAAADAQFVQVEFTVDADGGVSAARIVQHDTSERFAGQVLSAVRDARFRPRFVDGQPVATASMTLREVLSVSVPAQPAAAGH